MVSADYDIDIATAEPFMEAVVQSVSNASGGAVLDLSRVRYIDSAGVRVLFELAERLSHRSQLLRLVVAPEGAVRRVVTIVGLPDAVPTEASVDAAVGSIEAARAPGGG